eukprot:Phypoly_transcript_18825.p1 GENE.Phypoly_transcript_18825~~Phypoly_transcript_18825.p1  ORF type:complete len:160 (+),score=19.44 Phypoly_transcript_18825:196-675(+)
MLLCLHVLCAWVHGDDVICGGACDYHTSMLATFPPVAECYCLRFCVACCVLWCVWMHGDDGAYYEVVDVDSSQFIDKLSHKWKKLENALENCSIDPLSREVAVNLLDSKQRGEELCRDLREVYDLLFYEEFDDMDKFVKLRNYYAELKHEYDSMLSSID